MRRRWFAICSVGRYYDPATAVFLTVDPIVSATNQPYGYATEDPINEYDLNGKDPWGASQTSELSSVGGRVKYAFYSFTSLGLTRLQGAALTGSLFEESNWTMAAGVKQGGCNPSLNCGRGIAQWGVHDRWPAMLKAEGGRDSYVGEVDYVYVEMQQRGNWNQLRRTRTLTGAMRVVIEKFEGPLFKNTTCRLNTARNILRGAFGVPGAGC